MAADLLGAGLFQISPGAGCQGRRLDMSAVNESKVPTPAKAKRAFIEAMDNWDEAAADTAVTGLVRAAGANELFDLLLLTARGISGKSHKAIYVANSWRTLPDDWLATCRTPFCVHWLMDYWIEVETTIGQKLIWRRIALAVKIWRVSKQSVPIGKPARQAVGDYGVAPSIADGFPW